MSETALSAPVAGARWPDFGLYVHWPFCVSKCPYCDFNSHVADDVDAGAWKAALLAELDHFGSRTTGRTLETVFFGGGTPSLMPPDIAAAILDRASEYWTLAPDLEVTLEANPSSVETGKFKDFKSAGVNRVSIGVQSFDDAALRFLGRAHDAAAAAQAVSVAQQTFERFSFDLIYALPGHTPVMWRRILRDALARAGDHLSLYQLTIEKGTAFFPAYRDEAFQLPDDDTAAELFEVTAQETADFGLPAYEISNHARPGGECRHNLIYWQGGDYAGIGPGAHGRLRLDGRRMATSQTPGPAAWLQQVGEMGCGSRDLATVSDPEQVEEYLLTGLRLTRGIDRNRFERLTGVGLDQAVDKEGLDQLRRADLVVLDESGLRVTEAGRQRLNAVIAKLMI